jgi:hypothetical protein
VNGTERRGICSLAHTHHYAMRNHRHKRVRSVYTSCNPHLAFARRKYGVRDLAIFELSDGDGCMLLDCK